MATTRDLVKLAVRAAEDRKAQQLAALDLRGLSTVTDYFVVCSGTSDTHVRAIADAVREKLLAKGQRPFSLEGYAEGTWVLLDYVDFVVHVFHYEKRLFYGIEELWADAKSLALGAAAAKKPATKRSAPAKRAAAKRPAAKKASRAKKVAPVKKAAARKAAPRKGAARG
jgi:ribosome-associated protein